MRDKLLLMDNMELKIKQWAYCIEKIYGTIHFLIVDYTHVINFIDVVHL